MTKKKKSVEPRIVRPEDIDPAHQWDRPLPAPGHTQVDFEERINFRRLHDYRLARTRAALANSGLGALLCFDQHNIRYTTSTVIGEWARDKLTRYSLLTGNGDPYIWDFGSAAKHHRLHAPWLHHDHCRAGLLGLRGAVGSDITLFREAARQGIRDLRIGDEPALRHGFGLCRGDQRDFGRALLAASAQFHRPAHPAWGPGVLRYHPVVHGLQDVLLPHLQRGQGDLVATN